MIPRTQFLARITNQLRMSLRELGDPPGLTLLVVGAGAVAASALLLFAGVAAAILTEAHAPLGGDALEVVIEDPRAALRRPFSAERIAAFAQMPHVVAASAKIELPAHARARDGEEIAVLLDGRLPGVDPVHDRLAWGRGFAAQSLHEALLSPELLIRLGGRLGPRGPEPSSIAVAVGRRMHGRDQEHVLELVVVGLSETARDDRIEVPLELADRVDRFRLGEEVDGMPTLPDPRDLAPEFDQIRLVAYPGRAREVRAAVAAAGLEPIDAGGRDTDRSDPDAGGDARMVLTGPDIGGARNPRPPEVGRRRAQVDGQRSETVVARASDGSAIKEDTARMLALTGTVAEAAGRLLVAIELHETDGGATLDAESWLAIGPSDDGSDRRDRDAGSPRDRDSDLNQDRDGDREQDGNDGFAWARGGDFARTRDGDSARTCDDDSARTCDGDFARDHGIAPPADFDSCTSTNGATRPDVIAGRGPEDDGELALPLALATGWSPGDLRQNGVRVVVRRGDGELVLRLRVCGVARGARAVVTPSLARSLTAWREGRLDVDVGDPGARGAASSTGEACARGAASRADEPVADAASPADGPSGSIAATGKMVRFRTAATPSRQGHLRARVFADDLPHVPAIVAALAAAGFRTLDRAAEAEKLQRLTDLLDRAVRHAGAPMLLLAALAVLCVTLQRVRARRTDIGLQRLCGIPRTQIVAGYAVQGVVAGLFGFGLALAMFVAFGDAAIEAFAHELGIDPPVAAGGSLIPFSAITRVLAASVLAGALGATLAAAHAAFAITPSEAMRGEA